MSILPAGKNEVEAEKRAEADDVDVAAEVELVQLEESDPLLLLTLPARDITSLVLAHHEFCYVLDF